MFPFRNETTIWRILAEAIGLLIVAAVFVPFLIIVLSQAQRLS